MDLNALFPAGQAVISKADFSARLGIAPSSTSRVAARHQLARVGLTYYVRPDADRLHVIAEMNRAAGLGIYQVGWMTAAWLHGAAAECPERAEVALSEQPTFDRPSWRSRLHGHVRPDADRRPAHVLPHSYGLPVTTPDLTIVDLATDRSMPQVASTILALAERGVDMAEVTRLLAAGPRADVTARRLGFVFEAAGHDATPLRVLLRPRTRPVLTDTAGRAIGDVNDRWGVRING